MNLLKCDKCGNRNIMCFACEKNSHYIETNRSHDNYVRNKAIEEFVERLKETMNKYIEDAKSEGDYTYIKPFEIFKEAVDEIAEEMRGAE